MNKKIKLNPEHGKRLKECLDDKKMLQKELAEKSNYTKQYISYIVCGKKNMSLESARIFADILGVREDYLLCKTDFKTANEELSAFVNGLSELDEIDDMAEAAAMELLKLHGISSIEYFRIEPDEEVRKIEYYFERMGMNPPVSLRGFARVQVGSEKPQDTNAEKIHDCVQEIIEFAKFQAEKIKDELNFRKAVSKLARMSED